MVHLQNIRLWALPANFFEVSDAERFEMMHAVTSDASLRDTLRQPPPMPVIDQLLAIMTCSLVAVPLLLPVAWVTLLIMGYVHLLSASIALVAVLCLHPIRHSLVYRRNRFGLLWARYFGFEILLDRDQSPSAAVAATPAVLAPSQPDGGTAGPGGVGRVNLACPHGVMNFGAMIFTFFSRWLCGSDQRTAVADAVTLVPGLRHVAAPLWPVSAARKSVDKWLAANTTLGVVPDGIGGIFEAAGSVPWGEDALSLGRKRGLMKLLLRHGATCMPGYFIGTLQLFSVSQDPFGILRALSRQLRVSLFFFHGRFGLPIPRRGPITAVVAFVPAPSGPMLEPTEEQVEAHHKRVYGALVDAYDTAKACVGLGDTARLQIK
jgi:hypothetical protein